MPQIKYKYFFPVICKETEKGINNLRWAKKVVQYNAMLNIKKYRQKQVLRVFRRAKLLFAWTHRKCMPGGA